MTSIYTNVKSFVGSVVSTIPQAASVSALATGAAYAAGRFSSVATGPVGAVAGVAFGSVFANKFVNFAATYLPDSFKKYDTVNWVAKNITPFAVPLLLNLGVATAVAGFTPITPVAAIAISVITIAVKVLFDKNTAQKAEKAKQTEINTLTTTLKDAVKEEKFNSELLDEDAISSIKTKLKEVKELVTSDEKLATLKELIETLNKQFPVNKDVPA